MEPVHSVEYEMTTELASEIHRALMRWQLRRGWWRDVPTFSAALVFAVLLIWFGLTGWILPGVAGGLLCLLTFFTLGAVMRRWSRARAATTTALLALQSSDRRIRIEFNDERVRLETEFFRGEGTWTELDEVVVFDGFWVLHLSNGGQVVVPGTLVSNELEAFIRTKAENVTAPIHQG
jgi:hypothetical protein